MTQDKRLDNIMKSLTPKQAVVLWLEEIQQYQNAEEYVRFLRSQPESAAPITRLTTQIDQTVRASMKGQPKEAISVAVRRAVEDVVFLVKLHHQVNFKVMTELKAWRLTYTALTEMLNSMRLEFLFRSLMVEMTDRINWQTPYPLEPDIASAVESAIRHYVYSWEALNEDDTVEDWLWDSFMNQGAVRLPEDSFRYMDGRFRPALSHENEESVRKCFSDSQEFELFKSGEDYTNGLASIRDAEYRRRYETIVSNMHGLVDSGEVQEGSLVSLDTVPIPFLRAAPLLDGVWVDSKVIELAEWGALLQARGYQLKQEDNQNSLAPVKFLQQGGRELDRTEIKMFQRIAARHLKKFPGHTRKIAERNYIHFEGYCSWQSRAVRGDLQQCIKKGLITDSWNNWVSDHGSESVANLNGVPAGILRCWVDQYDYYPCPNRLDGQLKQREKLLEDMRHWACKPEWKEQPLREWQAALCAFLGEIYALRQAFTSISKGYFEGHPVLFPDLTEVLPVIITETEKLVNSFNDLFADTFKLCESIDLEALRQSAGQQADSQMAYIINMAKAEALSCLGDEQAAMRIAERYL